MCTCWSRYMNKPGTKTEQYRPTNIEQAANIITHAICIPFAIVALCAMNGISQTDKHRTVSLLYGFSLVFLALISTLFHTMSLMNASRKMIKTFHMMDRFIIYIFIAAAYTPWIVLQDLKSIGIGSVYSVWACAIAGVIYTILCYDKYKTLDTVFYVLTGVLPALPLASELEKGHWEFTVGGLTYIAGIKFFRSDGKVPFAHAIWHVFVAIATTVHFVGVWRHLY